MRKRTLMKAAAAACLAAAALMLAWPARRADTQGAQIAAYREALARTDPGRMPLLKPGMPAEAEALERFRQFYLVYSAASISAGVRRLYAPDAYFGDPFRSVNGIDAIEAYFLKMAEPVRTCTFTIDRFDAAGAEYYCTWEMRLVSRAAPKREIRAPGVSHVRFSPDGQVVFQQDYWDSSTMFDNLSVVGRFTRFVKRRLE